ncbi:hypothetical protein QE152_g9397 [Popillia japonica]|uniref:Endonuclease-reverse transcriptase n=1 Tax=Popillia japonica TaxID=7064 RepID=A0AAW1LY29_POPJA
MPADSRDLRITRFTAEEETHKENCGKRIVSEFKEQVKALTNKVVSLEVELKSARLETIKAVNDLEQYSRRNSIRIYGVPEHDKENINTTITGLCHSKLGVEVSEDMIDCCHRLLGKQPNHRPILVKFVSRDIKKRVYANKKKLKGSKIVIREDLTAYNNQLIREAATVIREDLTAYNNQLIREAATKFGVRSVWSSEGKIFVKINNKIRIIKNTSDLT